MKFSFKQVATTLIAFMLGILTSETITDQQLIIETVRIAWESSTFWTAFTGAVTLASVLIALYIAREGWDKSEKARVYEFWRQKALDADIAYLHFYHLSRSAILVTHTRFKETPEFEKVKFKEVYDSWGASLLNERIAGSIIKFRNWPNTSFTDDMEIRLNSLVLFHNSTNTISPEAVNRTWQDITLLLQAAAEISHIHLLECRDKADAAYNRPPDKDREQAINESKKEIKKIIQEYKNPKQTKQ